MKKNPFKSIAIYAPRPRSGKTTAAGILVKCGFRLVQFSAPLRDPLYAAGLDTRHVEGELKEVPFPEGVIAKLEAEGVWPSADDLSQLAQAGKWQEGAEVITPRDFMKARALILGDDMLITIAQDKIHASHAENTPVVLDDLRWPSQYDYIASYGDIFQIWRIERPLKEGEQNQAQDSRFEGLLENRHFEHNFVNDGSIEDLEYKVLLQSLPPERRNFVLAFAEKFGTKD